jgi:two-component system chemotaxis response regulator CheB
VARTKVLVVDDSALMRQLLTDLLGADPGLEVVGAAADPYAAWDKLKQFAPDVLTLDVEMPRMDGLTFLGRVMAHRPVPVVMVSSLTERDCDTTLRALELGAVDFVTKPKLDMTTGTLALADEIVAKVKAAARARPRPRAAPARLAPAGGGFNATHKVLAVGASTGGCEALATVLGALPADAPGVVAVIHMPEGFTRSFAARLDKHCAVRVAEAKDGDRVVPGHVLLAPGNFHMSVVRSGAVTTVRVAPGPPVNRHRPAVDVLFQSCAKELGPNAAGALLTGMGDDGARGLLAMRRAGGRTIAQDEASCVVFGMPKEAIALGGVDEVLPLDRIAGQLLRAAR